LIRIVSGNVVLAGGAAFDQSLMRRIRRHRRR
jgi:hypothetical protein